MNTLYGKLYQFRLRYIFDNNEKSVWSFISKVALPRSVVGIDYLYNSETERVSNAINISFNTQQKEIVAIEIAVREGNKGQWALLDRINKYDSDWNTLIASDIEYTYTFSNEKVLMALDQEDCSRPYDYIPQVAECSELINENQIVDAGITEDRDNTNIDISMSYIATRHNTGFGSAVQPDIQIEENGTSITFYEYPVYSTSEVVVLNTVTNVNAVARVQRDELMSDSQVTAELVAQLVAEGVQATQTDTFVIFITEYEEPFIYDVQSASVVVTLQSVKSLKYGKEHQWGIIYYDNGIRSSYTNVSPQSGIKVPPINEVLSERLISRQGVYDTIQASYQINHIPPKWAKYWQWAYADTHHSFEQSIVYKVRVDALQKYVYVAFNSAIEKLNTERTESTVKEWVYEKGDRLKFIGKYYIESQGVVMHGETHDYPILEYLTDTKEFKIPYDASFATILPSFVNHIVEVYRKPFELPVNNEGMPYHEIGELNPILNPFTDNRAHGHANSAYKNQIVANEVNISSASGLIDYGDVYIRRRICFPDGTTENLWAYPLESSSFDDLYESDVHNIGRVNVVNINARRVKLPMALRWGGNYVQQSRINNLCRYNYDDFDFVTEKYGAITRLKQIGEVLACRQQYRSTSIYVGRVELRQSAIEEGGFVAMSERLLGTRYVSKEKWGCVNPESEVQAGQISYYFDLYNGAIIADGYNKPQPISDLGLRNYVKSLALQLQGKKNIRVVGGYDHKNDWLWYSFSANEFTPVTLVWKEGWKCFVQLPLIDVYSCIGQTFLTFKQGELWLHNVGNPNQFYGSTLDTEVNLVFNGNPNQNKIFRRIRLNTDGQWSCPEYGDVSIAPTPTFPQMQTKIPAVRLRDEEGMYYSDIPRNAGTPPTMQKWINGEPMRGTALRVRLKNDQNTQVSLFTVGVIEQPT